MYFNKDRYMYFKCNECGRFMSYSDLEIAKVYTPFGSTYDYEPPDEVFIHRSCYDKLTPSQKSLISRISWQEGT